MTNVVTLPNTRRRDIQDWRIRYWAAKRREAERTARLYGSDEQA